jgi:hypothetical protein
MPKKLLRTISERVENIRVPATTKYWNALSYFVKAYVSAGCPSFNPFRHSRHATCLTNSVGRSWCAHFKHGLSPCRPGAWHRHHDLRSRHHNLQQLLHSHVPPRGSKPPQNPSSSFFPIFICCDKRCLLLPTTVLLSTSKSWLLPTPSLHPHVTRTP